MSQPEKFEHYELLKNDDGSFVELGHGAMGLTYKAFDTNLRCPVALKVINATYLNDATAAERFLREARGAAALRHRNVASVFHLGRHGDSYFYSMEFIEGETVDARVKRDGPLAPAMAVEIASQVASALIAAHKQGLIHRDIKPSNLMLIHEDDGEMLVKVIDFGLVKSAVLGGNAGALTSTGFVGTPYFASPEQLDQRQEDIRSDIYSLGVTLWFMLTGQPTFRGSVASVIAQHLDKTPAFESLAILPTSVITVLQRMLEKDPDKRIQTPVELRTELRNTLGTLSYGALPPRNLSPGASVAPVALSSERGLTAEAKTAGGSALPVNPATASAHGSAGGSGSARLAGPPSVASASSTPPAPAPVAPSASAVPSASASSVAPPSASSVPAPTPSSVSRGEAAETMISGLANPPRSSIQVPVRTESTPLPAAARLPPPVSKKPIIAGVIATVVLLGVGAVVIFQGDSSKKNPPPGKPPASTPGVKPITVAPRQPPQPGKPWKNSLDMRYVPVGDIWFATNETRVRDFDAFFQARHYDAVGGMYSLQADGFKDHRHSWQNPGFPQSPEHPVVGVSYDDAKLFCEWLTMKERAEGALTATQFYRLPTDREWSEAVGLPVEAGATPEDRSGKVKGGYPWGKDWPPPADAGNYAGSEAKPGTPDNWVFIANYRDGFARTAPVPAHVPNALGISDLGGNVWEWCDDPFNKASGWRTLRGGSWATSRQEETLSSFRRGFPPSFRYDDIGFRCVIATDEGSR